MTPTTIPQDPEIDDFLRSRGAVATPAADPEIDAFLAAKKPATPITADANAALAAQGLSVAPPPAPPVPGLNAPAPAPAPLPPARPLHGFGTGAIPVAPPAPIAPPPPAPAPMPLAAPPLVAAQDAQTYYAPVTGSNPAYPNRTSFPVQPTGTVSILAEEPPRPAPVGPTIVTPVPAKSVQQPIDDRPDWKRWAEKPLITPEDVDEFFPFLSVGPFNLYRGGAKAVAGMSSPENIAIMAATEGAGLAAGAIPKAAPAWRTVSAGLSAYFGTQAGRALLEKYPELKRAVAKQDWQKALEMGGGALMDAAMVLGSAMHVGGEAHAVREQAGQAIDTHNARAAELVEQDRQAGLAQGPDVERKVARQGENRPERRANVVPIEEHPDFDPIAERVQGDRERIARDVFGKPVDGLTPDELSLIDDEIARQQQPPQPKRAGHPAARKGSPVVEPAAATGEGGVRPPSAAPDTTGEPGKGVIQPPTEEPMQAPPQEPPVPADFIHGMEATLGRRPNFREVMSKSGASADAVRKGFEAAYPKDNYADWWGRALDRRDAENPPAPEPEPPHGGEAQPASEGQGGMREETREPEPPKYLNDYERHDAEVAAEPHPYRKYLKAFGYDPDSVDSVAAHIGHDWMMWQKLTDESRTISRKPELTLRWADSTRQDFETGMKYIAERWGQEAADKALADAKEQWKGYGREIVAGPDAERAPEPITVSPEYQRREEESRANRDEFHRRNEEEEAKTARPPRNPDDFITVLAPDGGISIHETDGQAKRQGEINDGLRHERGYSWAFKTSGEFRSLYDIGHGPGGMSAEKARDMYDGVARHARQWYKIDAPELSPRASRDTAIKKTWDVIDQMRKQRVAEFEKHAPVIEPEPEPEPQPAPPANPAAQPRPKGKVAVDRSTMAKITALASDAQELMRRGTKDRNEVIITLGNIEKALGMVPEGQFPQIRKRLEAMRETLRNAVGGATAPDIQPRDGFKAKPRNIQTMEMILRGKARREKVRVEPMAQGEAKYPEGAKVEWQYGKTKRQGEITSTPEHPDNNGKYFVYTGSEMHPVPEEKIIRRTDEPAAAPTPDQRPANTGGSAPVAPPVRYRKGSKTPVGPIQRSTPDTRFVADEPVREGNKVTVTYRDNDGKPIVRMSEDLHQTPSRAANPTLEENGYDGSAYYQRRPIIDSHFADVMKAERAKAAEQGSGNAAEPAAKQPWQMTEQEWAAHRKKTVPQFVEDGEYFRDRYTGKHETVNGVWKDALKVNENRDELHATHGKTYGDTVERAEAWLNEHPEFRKGHDGHVEDAIRAGKPVPAEVLADYPEMVKQTRRDIEKNKQPWQMTADEYVHSLGIRAGTDAIKAAHAEHSREVYEALRAGQPVPENVRRNYPNVSPDPTGGPLVVVACAANKEILDAENGRQARNAYQGDLFKKGRAYAEKVGTAWRVFSAKYGLIHPDQTIHQYDVTFNRPGDPVISPEELAVQIRRQKLADNYDRVVVVGGKEYVNRLREAAPDLNIEAPFAGKGIGEMKQALVAATKEAPQNPNAVQIEPDITEMSPEEAHAHLRGIRPEPPAHPAARQPERREWLQHGRSVGEFNPLDTKSAEEIGGEIGSAVAMGQWDHGTEGDPKAETVLEHWLKQRGAPRAEFSPEEWTAQAQAYRDAYDREVAKYNREPWQMTKAEYSDLYGPNDGDHGASVAEALDNGKPVPEEVLADYPDLAEKATAPEPPAAKPGTPEPIARPTPKEGDAVQWRTNGGPKTGEFRRVDANGWYEVESGGIRYKVDPEKVERTGPKVAPKPEAGGLERGMAVELKVDGQWKPAEIEEVQHTDFGDTLYDVSYEHPRDPEEKAFARVAADQVRVPEAPKAGSPEAEAKFQEGYAKHIAQVRQRGYIDLDEQEVLRAVHKFATEGDGASMHAGKRDAILHRVTEMVKVGRKKEEVTKWRVVATDERQGTLHRDFRNPTEAAEWAADMVYSIGRPRSDWSEYGSGRGNYGAHALVKRGSLLGNNDTGFAAADAAARALGRPGLANDIYMKAFGGGMYGAKPGMTLKEIAEKYADALPANDGFALDRVKEKNYGSGMEDEHRQLLRPADRPPNKGHGWSWERLQEDFERAANGMREYAIKNAERDIQTAKKLNGGETTPRIAKAEQVVADAKAAIDRNLQYVKDQVKAEMEGEAADLEPKARAYAEAYAKYGKSALEGERPKYEKTTDAPQNVLARYSKLREIEGGWPGVMEHFGIKDQPKPERVPVPLNGPGRLLKGEIEALKGADLTSGFIRPADTGTQEKLVKRGWMKPDANELTEAGRAAVYSYRNQLGDLEAGRPISEYTIAKPKLASPGDDRFLSSVGAWNKVDGDVWHTNGHGAWRGEYPDHWPPRDKEAKKLPEIDRVIPKEKGEPVKPVGFATKNAGEPNAQTLIYFSDGSAMAQHLYDYTAKRYPDITWTRVQGKDGRTHAEAFQAWGKDGKRVAIVMPMRDPGVPPNLKDVLPGEPVAMGAPMRRRQGEPTQQTMFDAASPTPMFPPPGPKGTPAAPPARGSGNAAPAAAPAAPAAKSRGPLGIAEWFREDVKPLGAKTLKAAKQARDTINAALDPASLSTEASWTANRLRQAMGERAHALRMAAVAMESARKYFQGKDFKTEVLPFLDAVEGGRKQVGSTPEETAQLQAFADTMRDILDKHREVVQRLGTGKLANFIETYFPHIWKDPDVARDVYKDIVSRSGNMEGPKSFLHQRSIDSIAEGIKRGLTPAYENPVEMVLAKLHEMDKYIVAHQALKWQKSMKLAKFIPVDFNAPKGWTTLDDPIFTVYGSNKFAMREFNDARLTDGLNAFARSLGIEPVRKMSFAGVKGVSPNTAGFTYPNKSAVYTKFATPESVLAHEIGHQIEFKYKISDLLKARKEPGLAAEMRNLADLRIEGLPKVSERYKKYIRNMDEKMANAIAAAIYAPEKFQRVAPKVWDALRDEMWHIPALKPFFDLERSMVLGHNDMPFEIKGIRKLGQYYMPPEVAQVYKNYLSPGLRHSDVFRAYLGIANTMNQFQLGFSAYHAGFTVLDSYMSKAALGLMQASRGDVKGALGSAARFATAPVENFVRGRRIIKAYETGNAPDPQTAQDVRNMEISGARAAMDSVYATKAADRFMEAVKGHNVVRAMFRAVPALADVAMKPIMEKMVPAMKAGALADLTRLENKRLDTLDAKWKAISDQHQTPQGYDLDAIANDPQMDRKGRNEALRLRQRIGKQYIDDRFGVSSEMVRESMALAQNSIDNRMGEMVYDNKFMNRAVKDALQASVRSVGWNMGTILEHGGGAKDALTVAKRIKDGDPAVTARMAYLFMTPLVMGLAGAMVTKLATGDGPKEAKDLFFPRTGNTDEYGRPERWSLPSYMKEWAHLYFAAKDQDPGAIGRMAGSKLHPAITAAIDMLQNRDYYGTQIIDPDNVGQSLITGIAKQFMPFAARGVQRERELGGTATSKVLPFVGITPAPAYINKTAAERLIDRYTSQSASSAAKTPEVYEQGRVMRETVRALRSNRIDDANRIAGKGLGEGAISDRDVSTIRKRAELTPLESAFDNMRDKSGLRFIEVMKVATPEERQRLAPLFLKKMSSVNQAPTSVQNRARLAIQKAGLTYLFN